MSKHRIERPASVWAALLPLTLLLAGPALAYDYEDDDAVADYGAEGWYMGLDFGAGLETASRQRGNQEILAIRLGYRAQDNFSSELQFESSDIGDDWILTFNAKVPLTTRRIQPFVGYGLGVAEAFGTIDAAFRAGGGIDLHLTNSVAVSVHGDYVRGISDLENLHYVSVTGGLFVRF